MSLESIRRANLRAVIAQHGGLSRLSRKLEYTQSSYLSQVLHGQRPFSEKPARMLEQRLEMPVGWLDTDRDSQNEVGPVPIDVALLAKVIAVLEGLGDYSQIPTIKRARIAAKVYADAMRTGEIDRGAAAELLYLAKPE